MKRNITIIANRNNDGDNEEDEQQCYERCEYVELYWNDDSHVLKQVAGVHKVHGWQNLPDDIKVETTPNEHFLLETPTMEEISINDDNMNMVDQVQEIAKNLVEHRGYTELEDFLQFHQVHIPCFTWMVVNQDDDDDDDSEVPVTSSQIGGRPALYKGEDWPQKWGEILAFQINLETLPARMQCITGNSGLLQVFCDLNGMCFDCGTARIIPPQDFDQLERSLHSVVSNNNGHRVPITTYPRRLITGWVERPDYPVNYDCPVDWEDDVKDKSEELSVSYDKFGGYGRYCQDGGIKEEGFLPCENCQQSHLYAREVFHMVHQGMLRLEIGDLGTAHLSYCPLEPEKTLAMECSCY